MILERSQSKHSTYTFSLCLVHTCMPACICIKVCFRQGRKRPVYLAKSVPSSCFSKTKFHFFDKMFVLQREKRLKLAGARLQAAGCAKKKPTASLFSFYKDAIKLLAALSSICFWQSAPVAAMHSGILTGARGLPGLRRLSWPPT